MTSKIRFKESDIPIKISYKQAMYDFKDMGLNLLAIFGEESSAVQTIMLDDEIMVQVWFSYVKKHHAGTLESALEELTPELMNDFREKFWNEVINFMPPLTRPSLNLFMEKMKEEMTSPEKRLEQAFSASSEEQESTPPT